MIVVIAMQKYGCVSKVQLVPGFLQHSTWSDHGLVTNGTQNAYHLLLTYLYQFSRG